MAKARLNFDGDNVYTEKEGRVHKLTQEVETAIDGIPDVVDSLTSTSASSALSANQGRLLQAEIKALESVGRFLSTWDCTTGLPATNPLDNPYTYKIGDYYIISAIADTSQGGINLRPSGSTYTADVASTAQETLAVSVNDWYLYDGSSWILQASSGATIAIDTELSAISTNAVQNKKVYEALEDKQDTISDLSTIRSGAALGATALQSGDNVSELVNDASYATTGGVATAVAAVVSDSSYNESTWDGVSTIAPSKNAVRDVIETKQNILTPGDNITISGNTISATNTTYSNATSSTAGIVKLGSDTVQSTGANSVTSTASRTYAVQENSSNQLVVNVPWTDNNTTYSTATSSTAGVIKLGDDTVQTNASETATSTANRTYPVQVNASGQAVVNVPWTDNNTTYTAGNNVQINGTTISATDTTYPTLTAANIQTGTATTASVTTAKNLADSLVRISSNTSGSGTQIWTGTQTEYEALSAYDSNTIYFVTDD